MEIIYRAKDGKEFKDIIECENYEWLLDHGHLRYVSFLDKAGNKLKDIMSEDTYFNAEKIIVPSDKCAEDLRSLADYTGFCCYDKIKEKGM